MLDDLGSSFTTVGLPVRLHLYIQPERKRLDNPFSIMKKKSQATRSRREAESGRSTREEGGVGRVCGNGHRRIEGGMRVLRASGQDGMREG